MKAAVVTEFRALDPAEVLQSHGGADVAIGLSVNETRPLDWINTAVEDVLQGQAPAASC